MEVVKMLYHAGIRAVEFTNRGDQALKNFEKLRKLCNTQMKDMLLGVGTITNVESVEGFLDADADFVISPGLVKEVLEVCEDQDVSYFPGCMTPSEIIAASNLGATVIKLFPGSLLGSRFVRFINSIFPDLLFIPTGGISTERENLKDWFDAGVFAVGIGSKLIRKDLLAQKNYKQISELARQTVEIISSIREESKK